MKIAATKTFTKELNKALIARDIPYKAIYKTCVFDQYFALVDAFNTTTNIAYDYISKYGTMRYIDIVYPDNYHAMNKHVTTNELNSLYRAGDTINTYFARVIDYISI